MECKQEKMRKIVIILSVLALLVGVGYRVFIADEFMFSEHSPDKQYRVDVYIFAMPGDGGVGSRTAVVVLKNKWGWTIGKSCDECNVFYGDVDIEWNCFSKDEVCFAKARSINLKTGKCCD